MNDFQRQNSAGVNEPCYAEKCNLQNDCRGKILILKLKVEEMVQKPLKKLSQWFK